MKSTPRLSIHRAQATRSSAARLSPITLTPKSLPASTTRRMVASCARPITTTRFARARHHLGFQVAAVHRLQVGDDRMVGEARPQCLDRTQPVREEQRRAGFQPVHSGCDADGRRVEGLVQRREVERELDNRVGEIVQVHGESTIVQVRGLLQQRGGSPSLSRADGGLRRAARPLRGLLFRIEQPESALCTRLLSRRLRHIQLRPRADGCLARPRAGTPFARRSPDTASASARNTTHASCP